MTTSEIPEDHQALRRLLITGFLAAADAIRHADLDGIGGHLGNRPRSPASGTAGPSTAERHQSSTGVRAGGASDQTSLVSLTAAAGLLGIHRTTAYALARKGTFPIPVVKVGSLLKVNRQALDDYLG